MVTKYNMPEVELILDALRTQLAVAEENGQFAIALAYLEVLRKTEAYLEELQGSSKFHRALI